VIEKWEFRRGEQCYLSLPADKVPRYRVRAQGSKWMAHRIRFTQIMPLSGLMDFIGSFDTAREARKACSDHKRRVEEANETA